ncbi:MAG: hypothetical protein SFY69_12680 [Planctomycetota bacterium]|nr:hypothetical protein [Planctomycetota bacterium]
MVRLTFVLCLAAASAAFAQSLTTAFTYQGTLRDAGQPAGGSYDLRFRLFDSATDGLQQGATLCTNDAPVVQGQFASVLDFGAQYPGARRWLQIEVRPDVGTGCADDTGWTILTPRQELTLTPYAARALSAGVADDASNLNGEPGSSIRTHRISRRAFSRVVASPAHTREQ